MKSTWHSVKLEQALRKSEEWIDLEPEKKYKEVTVRLWGKGVILRGVNTGAEIAANRRLVVREGQLILSRIDASNGALGIVPVSLEGAIVSNDFPTFNVNRSLALPGFFRWLVKTQRFVQLCKNASEGTTNRVRLKEEKFLATHVSLPPIDEQRRIVSRLEELAAKIGEARGLRNEATVQAEAFRAAVSNALVEMQRQHNWPSSALGEIADVRSGVTLGRALNGPTVRLPYLRVANVQDGHLDLSLVKETDILATEIDKWQLKPGDILLTEGGDWDKLGRGTVWHGEIPDCIHQNHIFRIRTSAEEFDSDFLTAVIGSPYGKSYFQAASKQTTNLASINQRQLKAFTIFRPALSEQRRVVTYLQTLQAKVDTLKKMQAETAKELDALMPSILSRAFRGDL